MAVFKNFRRAYHLKFASTTVQKANSVHVRSNMSSAASLCSSHFRRLRQSSSVIFQCLRGSASRRKWDEHNEAAEDMFERTWTKFAFWTVVEANFKWYARLKFLKTAIRALESLGLKD